jgi:hypothetical protein
MEAISEFFGSALNCLYGVLLGAGFLYSLFLLIAQGAGGHDLLGHVDVHVGDLDLGGHDIGVHDVGVHDLGHDTAEAVGISTLAIASAISAFGAFGIASRALFHLSDGVSLLVALAGGLVIGGLAQAFFIYILVPTATTTFKADSLIGHSAEVITAIPEDKLGQIALVASGSRVTFGARASDGSAVERGTTVTIEKIVGGVAYVSPEPGPPWV